MSMCNYPGSGYLITALSFSDIVKREYTDKFNDFMTGCKSSDVDLHNTVLEIISDICRDKNMPLPSDTVWFCSEDDIDDDLEYNTLYVRFDAEVLYQRTLRKELINMSSSLNIIPKHYMWSIYG